MKSMVKFLMIGTGFALMLTGVIALIVLSRTQATKRAIETALTDAFGAPATIASAVLLPLERSLVLYGLRIENPPNFLGGTAVECGRTQIVFDVQSLMSDTLNIPVVRIENATLQMRHQMGEGANLTALASAPVPSAGTVHGRRYVIERIEFGDSHIEVSSNLAPSHTVQLAVASITVENPGGGSSMSAGEAGQMILRRAIERSVSVDGLLQPVAQAVREELGKFNLTAPSFLDAGVAGENTPPVP